MVAECVGLWLAEGDRKSESEITFTNSEPYLIRFFHECLRKLLSDNDFHVYSYSKSGRAEKPCNAAYIKCYIDKRARKPYYILRLCRTELVKKWSKIVRKIVPDKALWPHILRGFFAGEGNIKTGKHHSRQLRIAQGRENPSIERMLKHVGIGFRYSGAERSYVISGFWNWEIFAKYCISDLHPLKKARFWSVFRTFKQRHYKAHHIRNELLIMLKTPATTAHLAGYFKRSMARVQEILVDLKKEGLVNTFRVGSVNYWTTKKDIVII